jgi:phosphate transport system substrate-binding protein
MRTSNKRFITTIASLLLFAAAQTFAGDIDMFKGEKGVLRVSGGTAHIPVMKEAAKRIMSVNPDINITIAGGGSGVGIKQVGEGLVDIGNSGRKATPDEIARYDLKLFQWAIDGVTPVVNPANQIKQIGGENIQRIFSGKITNWKEVGGADQRINIYTRDEASGTREVFFEKAMKKQKIATSAHVVVSNGAMKTAIAGDPYGIGYVSVGHVDKTVTALVLDGVAPTIENVKNGKFPVARGLFSNTKHDPSGLTRKFLDYMFTPEGQKIVADQGFIPVK